MYSYSATVRHAVTTTISGSLTTATLFCGLETLPPSGDVPLSCRYNPQYSNLINPPPGGYPANPQNITYVRDSCLPVNPTSDWICEHQVSCWWLALSARLPLIRAYCWASAVLIAAGSGMLV